MVIYRIYEWAKDESNIYYVADKGRAEERAADLLSYYKSQGYADSEYGVTVEEYAIDKMLEEDGDLVEMELDADNPQYIEKGILEELMWKSLQK